MLATTYSKLIPSIIIYVNLSLNTLQEYPILMAVSILSPVRTQIYIPVYFREAIVLSTSSYN